MYLRDYARGEVTNNNVIGNSDNGVGMTEMGSEDQSELDDALDSLERGLDRFLEGNEQSATPRNTYAIGDVQGCFDDLLRLLDKLDFDPAQDSLWFTGDLVNKGPNSLHILRFVKGLGDSAVTVLGNHDLYLLGAAAGTVKDKRNDAIAGILAAHDCDELLLWLRHQPVLHHDDVHGYTMVHAGLPPQWNLSAAQTHARELEAALQGADYKELLGSLNDEKPDRWSEQLNGMARLGYFVDCFTQLRYCDRSGRLDLSGARRTAAKKKRSMPWFQVPMRANSDMKIIFGHWASLDIKKTKTTGVYPLDTGCSNGGKFTAMRLADGRIISTRCKIESHPGLG